eukprot:Nk52_evm57s32 gene=Nk52_evmTU57s32
MSKNPSSDGSASASSVGGFNFSGIKEALLAGGEEEVVQVNQRHLIDKILARYSGEHTVYRELIQNANDANATKVDINFVTAVGLAQSSGGGSTENSNTVSKSSSKCVRVVVRNNGHAFRQQDWDRLKKIAEGNPDENKIGFFGVGFYSVFSICEEPIIMSGNKCMGFYWKGDQLYISKMDNVKQRNDKIRDLYTAFSGNYERGNANEKDDLTVFVMDPRDPFKVENVEEFGLFLCKCIGFTKALGDISIAIDSKVIMNLGKQLLEKTPLPLEKLDPWKGSYMKEMLLGGMFGFASKHLVSPNGIFLLEHITLQKMIISVRSWDSMSSATKIEEQIQMSIASGGVKVQVAEEFAQRMLRVTKKRPPKATNVQLMFALYHSGDGAGLKVGINSEQGTSEGESLSLSLTPTVTANSRHNKSSSDRFQHLKKVLYPYPFEGRVFIGFPTHQSTGSSYHLACHVIPTVERESIDFIDADIGIWNQEMLAIPGIMSRMIFEYFMTRLNERALEGFRTLPGLPTNETSSGVCTLISSGELEVNAQSAAYVNLRDMEEEAVFAVQSLLSSKRAAPIEQVGEILHESFFPRFGSSYPDSGPRILTSHGVVASSTARLPKDGMEKFVMKAVPVVSIYFYNQCRDFFERDLLQRGLIKHVTYEDVIEEVKLTVFDQKKGIELLKWWIAFKKKYNSAKNRSILRTINNALHANLRIYEDSSDSDSECDRERKIIQFSSFASFLNPKVIPFHKYSELCTLVPENCLPLKISNLLRIEELTVLDWWKQMSVLDWLDFIASRPEFETSQKFSEQVFEVVYKNFFQSPFLPNGNEGYVASITGFLSKYYEESNFSAGGQAGGSSNVETLREGIVRLLRSKSCVATTNGMLKPSESYLKSVDFFNDLPHIIMFEDEVKTEGESVEGSTVDVKKEKKKSKGLFGSLLSWGGVGKDSDGSGSKPKKFRIPNSFWLRLGVRDRVDLKLIFQRLEGLDWNVRDLVKYLASIDLTNEEISRLANTPFLNSEKQVEAAREVAQDQERLNDGTMQDITAKLEKCVARSLYFPDSSLKTLGFPIFYWPSDNNGNRNTHVATLRPDSKEGIFLKKIGLQVYPPLTELLSKNVIHSDGTNQENNCNYDEYRASTVFSYLMAHYDSFYKWGYAKLRGTLAVPFVPCYQPKVDLEGLQFAGGEGHRPALCRKELMFPGQCFTDHSCSSMGFWIVQEQFTKYAEELKIDRSPSVRRTIHMLETWPPTISKCVVLRSAEVILPSTSVTQINTGETHVQGVSVVGVEAQLVFSYLSQRAHEFSSSDWFSLSQAKMIPVRDRASNNTEYFCANDVYFGGVSSNGEEELIDLFTYVNFEDASAHSFLKACGVKEEPTPEELAKELVNDPGKFYTAMGYSRYLSALRRMAVTLDSIAAFVPHRKLTTSKFLLGSRFALKSESRPSLVESNTETPNDAVSDDNVQITYELVSASECYLVDDSTLQRLFNPLCAPMETVLEGMYERLGSKWLSKQIKEEYSVREYADSGLTKASVELQKLIRARGPLLLYDGQNLREGLYKGASEKLKAMYVIEVNHIARKLSFKGQVVTESSSACNTLHLINDHGRGSGGGQSQTSFSMLFGGSSNSSQVTRNTNPAPKNTIFVINNFDYFDVASALSEVILKNPKLNDSLLISTLLQTSLDNLKRKGFPVDRILNIAPKRVVEETPQKKTANSLPAHSTDSPVEGAPQNQLPNNSSDDKTKKDALENLKKIFTEHAYALKELFPDCAIDYLIEFIRAEYTKNPNVSVNELADKLSSINYPRQDESIPDKGIGSDVPPKEKEQKVSSQPPAPEAPPTNNERRTSKSDDKKLSSKKSWKSFFGLGHQKPEPSSSKGTTPVGISHPGLSQPAQVAANAEDIRKHHDEHLNKSLQNAIKSCQPHQKGDLSKAPTQFAEPDPKFVQSSACDPSCAQTLKYLSSLIIEKYNSSIDLFLDEPLYVKYQESSQLGRNPIPEFFNMFLGPKENLYFVDVIFFSEILYSLGVEVFGLSPKTLHMFVGNVSDPTIAFNKGNSLFFNLRFFVTFDGPKWNQSASRAGQSYTIPYKCYTRWFMTMCHELAHCFQGPHDKVHEDYLSSFAENYFTRMDAVVRSKGIHP